MHRVDSMLFPFLLYLRYNTVAGGSRNVERNRQEQKEEQLNRELDKIDEKEVALIVQITTSWHERGRAEGRIEGTQEAICKYLTRKFGEESVNLHQIVLQVTNLELLDRVLEDLFAAGSLAGAQEIILKATGKSLQ